MDYAGDKRSFDRDRIYRRRCRESYEKFLQVLVQQQEINNREMKVRLIAPPPVKRGAWVDEERICREAEKLDKIYSKVAEELNMDFTGTGDWEITVAYDGVHFPRKDTENLRTDC